MNSGSRWGGLCLKEINHLTFTSPTETRVSVLFITPTTTEWGRETVAHNMDDLSEETAFRERRKKNKKKTEGKKKFLYSLCFCLETAVDVMSTRSGWTPTLTKRAAATETWSRSEEPWTSDLQPCSSLNRGCRGVSERHHLRLTHRTSGWSEGIFIGGQVCNIWIYIH